MAQAVTKWSIGTLRTFSHTIDVWRGKPVVPRLVLAERFGKLYHIWISCGSWTVTLSLELTTCLGSSAVDQLIHCPQLGLLAILYMRLHDEKTKVSKKNQSFPESRSCDLEIWRWNHLRNHVNERKKNSHISIWETQLGDVPNAGNKLNSGNIWLMSLGFKKETHCRLFWFPFPNLQRLVVPWSKVAAEIGPVIAFDVLRSYPNDSDRLVAWPKMIQRAETLTCSHPHARRTLAGAGP